MACRVAAKGSEASATSSSSSAAQQVQTKVADSKGVLGAASPPASMGGSRQQGVEKGMCVVCWAARSRVLMLPCRHLCCCRQCWGKVQAGAPDCPMCRQEVQGHLEVYV
jgi:hypothetical protein